MAEPEPHGVSLTTTDGRLRIDFRWQGDRFVQSLFIEGKDVGTSIEGDADDAWPPSPPLQQLSLQEINGALVILGVGAAGRGHWSISVEVEQDADAHFIRFDVACRSNDQPKFLGSTYRLGDSVEVHSSEADARLDVAESGCQTVQAVLGEGHTHRWSYLMKAKASQGP
jgi:hypothetical protein